MKYIIIKVEPYTTILNDGEEVSADLFFMPLVVYNQAKNIKELANILFSLYYQKLRK